MKTLPISFNNAALKAIKYRSQILESTDEVIKSGVFLEGKKNTVLEDKLKIFFKTPLVNTVSSGHDALLIALLSLGLDPQDEVLFATNVYPTAFAISQAGLKLKPVDTDENGQLDPQSLKKNISPHSKVIVVAHLYGQVGNVSEILSIGKKHQLIVIEDCAQSFGAEYKKEKVGTLGKIGCFSFYPTKNVSTLGDGGAIITKSQEVHSFINQAKSYGEMQKYNSQFVSFHSRMPEIQAAIAGIYLDDYSEELTLRRLLFSTYSSLIEKNLNLDEVRVLKSGKDVMSAPHLFVVQAHNRDRLREYLHRKRIPTFIHYPTPIHLVKAFASLQLKKGSFPIAEKLSSSILSLPFHPFLTNDQIEYIVHSIRGFYYG